MTSSPNLNRRLVEYHVARLKDRNPEIRRKAINELRLLSDPLTLGALEQVFYKDEDFALRQLAQEVGLEIYFRHRYRSKQ
jgi:hypothetical protein